MQQSPSRMAFASPPAAPLQQRLRERVRAATRTTRWQTAPALAHAVREARCALMYGVLPDVPLIGSSDDESEGEGDFYHMLLHTSSGRTAQPIPVVNSSSAATPASRSGSASRGRARRRLFVTVSDSEEDGEGDFGWDPDLGHGHGCGGKGGMEGGQIYSGLFSAQGLYSRLDDRFTRRRAGVYGDYGDVEGDLSHGEICGESCGDMSSEEDRHGVSLGDTDSTRSGDILVLSDDDDWIRSPKHTSSSTSSDVHTPSSGLTWGDVVDTARKSNPERSCRTLNGERGDADVEKDVIPTTFASSGTMPTKSSSPAVVIDLCDTDEDEDIASLVKGVQQVSIGGKMPVWLSQLSRGELARTRDKVAERLMRYMDNDVLSGRLGSCVTVAWNKRLLTTAGYTTLVQRGTERSASIDLSAKVLDESERLYMTMAHELCHAAAWIVDGIRRPAHGKVFKKWAAVFRQWDHHLNITRCHSFTIRCKYNYRCEKCAHVWGRHSKSIDTSKVRCSCKGLIVLQPVDTNFDN